jgi:hypothetical protein
VKAVPRPENSAWRLFDSQTGLSNESDILKFLIFPVNRAFPKTQGDSIYFMVQERGKGTDKQKFEQKMTKISTEKTMDITEADIIRMKESLAGIKDPRRERGNLRHKLTDMVVIALTTIIIGEHDFEAMEDGEVEREEWFRGFLELLPCKVLQDG